MDVWSVLLVPTIDIVGLGAGGIPAGRGRVEGDALVKNPSYLGGRRETVETVFVHSHAIFALSLELMIAGLMAEQIVHPQVISKKHLVRDTIFLCRVWIKPCLIHKVIP